jgi:single-strand DNA-binding protein
MASRSINRVILLGNLTRDPELKHTPGGTAVCTFALATNRSWITADGQTKEAQYHRIVAWQKLAELCSKLLIKGKKVYVEGRITYREYTTKEGLKKTVAEIVLDDFIVFNDNKKNEGSLSSDSGSHDVVKTGNLEHEEFDIAHTSPVTPSRSSKEDINPEDIPF